MTKDDDASYESYDTKHNIHNMAIDLSKLGGPIDKKSKAIPNAVSQK